MGQRSGKAMVRLGGSATQLHGVAVGAALASDRREAVVRVECDRTRVVRCKRGRM